MGETVKAFSIKGEQIASCIGAACADELNRRFNQYTDFLTIASWSGATPLGADGLLLEGEQREACAARAASLFGFEISILSDAASTTIADWALAIEQGLRQECRNFSFVPAGHESTECSHRADEMFQDAAAAANLLYGRRRLLSLVAPHSLFGFVVTILTPNLQLIESIDARAKTPDVLSQALAFGDVLVATPTLWRYMMREGLTAPDNSMAVSFGEPMTSGLAAEMRKAGFGALRELYGSTETGVIGWRDSPSEPFLLFDHWKNIDGELRRMSFSGGCRGIQVMDVIQWEGAKRFRLGGRRDGAVQIGAVNVFPGQIAKTIRAHPLVHECLVRAGKQAGGVNRLVAHIVLDKLAQPNDRAARDIDAWCRANLRRQERPRIYNFEKRLPRA